MNAFVYRPGRTSSGDSFRLEEVEIDTPRGDEVVVRTMATGICHSDLSYVDRRERAVSVPAERPSGGSSPGMQRRRDEEAVAAAVVLGHEASGIIEAVGADVIDVAPGDHVVCHPLPSCGRCARCADGHPHLCLRMPRRASDDQPRLSLRGQRITQFANLGAFAERMLVHESSVVVISPEVPFAAASLLGCGVLTGLGAVFNTAAVTAGSSVAVFGCGGVGLAAVQGARIAGALRIVAVDLDASRATTALALGATDAIDASSDDPVESILRLTSGEGVDYAFATAGGDVAAQHAYDALGARGVLTTVAGVPQSMGSMVTTEKRVQGSLMGSNRPSLDVPRWLSFYQQGRLYLDEMVTFQVPFERITEGLDASRRGLGIRSIVTFD